MKWLFVNPIKPGNWGGMENWMLNLAGALQRRGDDCLVVGRRESRWPSECKERDIAFAPLRFAFDLAPWTLARLHGICRGFKPDIGIAKGFRQCRFLRVAWPDAAIGCKLPAAAELTGARIDRWTYRKCVDRVLVDNHVARNAFLRLPWVLPGKVVTVHNGVRIFPAEERARRRADLHATLNIPAHIPIVASAGRFAADKRFPNAIEAFAQAVRSTDARLVLFGEGPDRGALGELAQRLGIAARTIFPGWKDNLRDTLPGADILLHTSAVEGLPNVVLEAMSGGVPVVATDAGGTREVLSSPQVGALVPCGDVPAMARCLGELLGDPARRQALGESAAAHVRQHFTIDAMAEGVRAAMTLAAAFREARRVRPQALSNGRRWVRRPDAPFGDEALTWPADPAASAVSANSKSAVVRVERPHGTFYIKTFRRSLLRTPAALRNFRLANDLALRGAAVVPHFAAAWRSAGARLDSTLFTGTPPAAIPLDRRMHDMGASPRRAAFAAALGRWLAHLHAAGIGAHDLKASNILVIESPGAGPAFVLLDLDNGRAWASTAPDRVVARNFHQVFRSFQKLLRPRDVQRFCAAYRRCRRMDRARFRHILAVAEKRLHRRGTGYAELPSPPAAPQPGRPPIP